MTITIPIWVVSLTVGAIGGFIVGLYVGCRAFEDDEFAPEYWK